MFNLQLTEQDVQVVSAALAELKLRDSLATFTNIKNQIDTQLKEKGQSDKTEIKQ